MFDAILLALTPVLALGLRIDTIGVPDEFRVGLLLFIGLSLPVKLFLFYRAGLYWRYWPYGSFDDFAGIILTVTIASGLTAAIFQSLIFTQLIPGIWLPRSVPLLDWILTLMVVGGSRFSVRGLESMRRLRGTSSSQEKKRALIVGAGDAGAMIVREMHTSRLSTLHPVGLTHTNEGCPFTACRCSEPCGTFRRW